MKAWKITRYVGSTELRINEVQILKKSKSRIYYKEGETEYRGNISTIDTQFVFSIEDLEQHINYHKDAIMKKIDTALFRINKADAILEKAKKDQSCESC